MSDHAPGPAPLLCPCRRVLPAKLMHRVQPVSIHVMKAYDTAWPINALQTIKAKLLSMSPQS